MSYKLNLDDIGYFLFMEQQEATFNNRSPEEKNTVGEDGPHKTENEEENS